MCVDAQGKARCVQQALTREATVRIPLLDVSKLPCCESDYIPPTRAPPANAAQTGGPAALRTASSVMLARSTIDDRPPTSAAALAAFRRNLSLGPSLRRQESGPRSCYSAMGGDVGVVAQGGGGGQGRVGLGVGGEVCGVGSQQGQGSELGPPMVARRARRLSAPLVIGTCCDNTHTHTHTHMPCC